MKTFLLIILACIYMHSYGQHTSYYDADDSRLSSSKHAYYYTITDTSAIDTTKISSYFISGQLKSSEMISNIRPGRLKPLGTSTEYYENGQLKKHVNYKDGHVSERFTYWKDGTPRRAETFAGDSMISGKCFSSKGEDTAYYPYHTWHRFPPGDTSYEYYIDKKLEHAYSNKPRHHTKDGNVSMYFKVNKKGVVSLDSISGGTKTFQRRAKRLTKKISRCIPATEDGEAVTSYFFSISVTTKITP